MTEKYQKTIIGKTYKKENFKNESMSKTKYIRCIFEECNPTGIDFSECYFDECEFIGGTYKKCNFGKSIFNDCSFETWHLSSQIKFTNCLFDNADLINCYYEASVFDDLEINGYFVNLGNSIKGIVNKIL